mmetsp:Transcript_40194/g.110690  ORF Transcript_40194/g.110690 Transcript_40194/m.110690 type:complete len:239 (-) Transcript_40194:233-949(-)
MRHSNHPSQRSFKHAIARSKAPARPAVPSERRLKSRLRTRMKRAVSLQRPTQAVVRKPRPCDHAPRSTPPQPRAHAPRAATRCRAHRDSERLSTRSLSDLSDRSYVACLLGVRAAAVGVAVGVAILGEDHVARRAAEAVSLVSLLLLELLELEGALLMLLGVSRLVRHLRHRAAHRAWREAPADDKRARADRDREDEVPVPVAYRIDHRAGDDGKDSDDGRHEAGDDGHVDLGVVLGV